MRRFLVILLVLVTAAVTGTYPARATPVTFSDVGSSFWAAPAIGTLAKDGLVHGFPDGSFRPQSLVTRAQFAGLLDAALNLAPYDPPTATFNDVPRGYWGYTMVETAARAGIIHGTGSGSFGPDRPVTRQDMAVMLTGALRLLTVAQDLAGNPAAFPDSAATADYAVGAVTAVSRLNLMQGLPDGRFQPVANASRAQAAQVIYRLVSLPPQAVDDLVAGVARNIVIHTPVASLAVDGTETVTAAVYDGQGRLLPLQPAWSASGGTISPAGVFTATRTGTAVITADLGKNLLAASATVLVTAPSAGPPQVPPTGSLTVEVPDPATVTAGGTLTINVQVLDNLGQPSPSDQGRAITLKMTTPSYHNKTLTATDAGGQAAFTVGGTLAGTYKIQAAATGLAPSPPAAFQVEPGSPVNLRLFAAPSPLVVPGRPVRITAAAVDSYGNPTPASLPVVLTTDGSKFGTFSPTGQNIAGNTALGTFTADGQSGSTTLTLTAPGTSYGPVRLTLQSLASPDALVAGKGMWLTYADWQNTPDDQIIATAKADNITHLYLEVAASSTGLYGQPALVDLLPKAHAAGIALVAWLYTGLVNPAQDAALASGVADFRTADGNGVDGLAVDMEENLAPESIASFAGPTRRALGPDYLLVAAVYAPQSYPGQTYASMYPTFAKYFTVLAPMDYWHNTPGPFSAAGAGEYVTQSLRMLKDSAGLPVEVVGQAYNMFTSGDYTPSGDEESAALAAARAGGAIGYSMYRWGSATPAQWQAFAAFTWQGGGQS